MYGLKTSKPDSALKNVDTVNEMFINSQNISPRFGSCLNCANRGPNKPPKIRQTVDFLQYFFIYYS